MGNGKINMSKLRIRMGRQPGAHETQAGHTEGLRPQDVAPHVGGSALAGATDGTLRGTLLKAEGERTSVTALDVSSLISGEEGMGLRHVTDQLTTPGLQELVARRGGYRPVLSGQIPELSGAFHLRPAARRKNPYRSDIHGQIPAANGFSNAWETGADIGKLVEKNPQDRFKFYLSLDLSTPEKTARANVFFERVHAAAAERQLSMLTKSEDHTFDSCNIYTWSPVEMAEIISEQYTDFQDIWLDTEHPLQGRLQTVDPKHIGYVQEPIGGSGAGSHSARMGVLGDYLDGGSTYEQACAGAGVLPEAPWLIAATE